MKKFALTLLTLTIIISASAQTPQAMNYQAIARNSLGQIVPSQQIGVRFTITDATGSTIFYQETHTTTTNNFGLFTLSIGKGMAVSGAIAPIDWSTGGDKFLKVEIAPDGSTNYTIQGTTQLISVPYALYAEKTKLIGGTAITITNGNTINANYQAGPGITITGNTISSTGWQLNGNAGTTASNFVGTTDDTRLNFRTNNITRMYLDKSVQSLGYDVGYLWLGDEASVQTHPAQLAIFGRDIAGVTAPMEVATSVQGQTFGVALGNTQGRLIRFSQMNTASFAQSHFYDLGISQDSSFYLSDHLFQNGGPVPPRKMFTISAQSMVGINMNMSEKPTANFHTKGTLRFEGVNTDNTLTRILAMDINGNVASRDASTLIGASNNWALTGNAGTTAANFLGTTDNTTLKFRVNNLDRFSISPGTIVGPYNTNYITIGDVSSPNSNNPVEVDVLGKDISGSLMPFGVNASIVGMTWSPMGGPTNTLGRLVRWAQWTGNTTFQFYDQGIDQEGDYFITQHGLSGTGGVFPKKMFQITATNNIGLNMDWTENPTANFYTKGTLRFEGINTNNTFTRVLTMDASGNVASRDASTFGGGFWTADAAGIHNNNIGHVGIGGPSNATNMLNVVMNENTIDGRPTANFLSNDSWQTNLILENSTFDKAYALVVGGTANTVTNYGVGAGNFGITNGTISASTSTIPLIITSDNKVGISNSNGGSDNLPKARFHVRDGDIYINDIGSGVIMKSPNGQCWRMTVSNTGTPVFTAIACP
jgi:hypothetical protein